MTVWSSKRSNSITSQNLAIEKTGDDHRPFSNGDTIKYRGDDDDEPYKLEMDASSDHRFLAQSPRLLSPP